MSSRIEILAKLADRSWYQNTALTTKCFLQSLPENCDGLLQQLADRPEEGGGVRLIRLCELQTPNHPGGGVYGAVAVFEVETLHDNPAQRKRYTYQYHCWKQGPASGTKGVVLLAKKRGDGKAAQPDDITHVGCLKGFSFAIGAETFDTIGGFADKPGLQLGSQFLEELEEEFGIPRDAAQEIIDLGTFYPDRGQTANNPALAAVVISAETSIDTAHDNPDPFEMRAGPVIVPVTQLWGKDGFGFRNQDAYFKSCVFNLIMLGRLVPPRP